MDNEPELDNTATPPEEVEGGESGRRGRGKPVSNEQRAAIIQALKKFTNSENKLKKGAIKDVAVEFNISAQSIGRIWKRGLESLDNGSVAMVANTKKQNCGRKKKDRTEALAHLETVPRHRKDTIRSAASNAGIPTTSFHRMLHAGGQGIRKVNVSAKPPLSQVQKQARIDYCLTNIDLNAGTFKPAFDVVHVDEKWFYLKKPTKTFYLTDNEPDPVVTIRNKRFIDKVMFLCAVARPRWDVGRNQWFDGKIGCWPIVEMVPAQRSSRNRPAGTLEMKSVNVTADRYKDMILNKVIPAIKDKWPANTHQTVYIQQDNATSHNSFSTDDLTYMFGVAQDLAAGNLTILPLKQPASSPDLNVLDLGFFTSIQALQQKKKTDNVPELVAAVEEAFQQLHRSTLNKVFLSHQKVMEQVILCDGGNTYKLPHMGKDRLQRNAQLPVAIEVSVDLRAKIDAIQGNNGGGDAPPIEMEAAGVHDANGGVDGPPMEI